MYDVLLQSFEEAVEFYLEATFQLRSIGFPPGSPELWELRNYWSRMRMVVQDHIDSLEDMLQEMEASSEVH